MGNVLAHVNSESELQSSLNLHPWGYVNSELEKCVIWTLDLWSSSNGIIVCRHNWDCNTWNVAQLFFILRTFVWDCNTLYTLPRQYNLSRITTLWKGIVPMAGIVGCLLKRFEVMGWQLRFGVVPKTVLWIVFFFIRFGERNRGENLSWRVGLTREGATTLTRSQLRAKGREWIIRCPKVRS
jgi:hypothetical protein